MEALSKRLLFLYVPQGEYKIQLEISQASKEDKGSYKFVAKNEKGEASSQVVEVTEIPEDDKPKGEAPSFAQGLKYTVGFFNE
jgi:hypothetical protein